MRLTKNNVCEFTYHTYTLEGLDMPSTQEIKGFYDHKKFSDEGVVPPLFKNRHIFNHLDAIDYVKKSKRRKLELQDVMEIHRIIIRDFEIQDGLRVNRAMLGTREAPRPEELPELMKEWWSTWGKSCYKSYTKKKNAFTRYCEFEYMYPFPLVNGIVGRLIYLWDCLYNKTQMDIMKDKDELDEKLKKYYELRPRIMQRWG